MVDLLKVGTFQPDIIDEVGKRVNEMKFRKIKDFRCYKEYENNGITVTFAKTKNGKSVYFTFSPHKQSNNNLHNANFFSLKSAQENIIKTLSQFNVSYNDYHLFNMIRLEVGVNYYCCLDSMMVLNSFLMFRTSFFKNDKYPHYRYADYSYSKKQRESKKRRTPNQTIKHYMKDKQEYNGITNAENGYCENDVIRTEIKLERSATVKRMGFNKLSDLYRPNALENCKRLLFEKLQDVFVFNPKEINKQKLKDNKQKKHFYTCTAPNFWQNINGRSIKDYKKRWNDLPKKYDTKEIIFSSIKAAIKEQNKEEIRTKNTSQLHQGNTAPKNTVNYSIDGTLEKEIIYHLSIDVVNTTDFYCVITGEKITMQRKGNPYLKREGLRYLYETNPIRFMNLFNAHRDTDNKRNAKTLEEKIILLETSIRKHYMNHKYKADMYAERNYSNPNQLQFRFN